MIALSPIEVLAQAAPRVAAKVLAVRFSVLFGSAVKANLSQALRTAKLLILQTKSVFDRHPLPAKNPFFRTAMPAFYFYFNHSCHDSLRGLTSRSAYGHFVEFNGGHANANGDALSRLAAGADAFVEF
jgi:hypothetical protein